MSVEDDNQENKQKGSLGLEIAPYMVFVLHAMRFSDPWLCTYL